MRRVKMDRYAKSELKRIHDLGCPSAIIAGGAVRDRIGGKPVKDIDIFISESEWVKAGLHYKAPSDWTCLGKDALSQSASGYLTNRQLLQVIDKTPPVNHHSDLIIETQLVIVNGDPVDHVDKYFDFGICKAWYDGSYIRCHSEFVRDMTNQTITLTLTRDALHDMYGEEVEVDDVIAAAKQHGKRIQSKYSSFDLILKPPAV